MRLIRSPIELPVDRGLVVGTPGVLLLILFFLAGVPDSRAQSSSGFSAFVAHIDEDGRASLTTQHAREMATGFSAYAQGEAALVASGLFETDPDVEEAVCADTSIPAAFEISLRYPDPVIGDRIYFEDIVVEAFDEYRSFVPGVPIILYELSPDDMLLSSPGWEYVEVAAHGFASFVVHAYCDQSALVAGSLNIIVEQ